MYSLRLDAVFTVTFQKVQYNTLDFVDALEPAFTGWLSFQWFNHKHVVFTKCGKIFSVCSTIVWALGITKLYKY